ncbi:MAG: NAD-dependent epimerase/dehydratase family protein [Opitutae bacterium]|nr:NAD-dependent epimerase/dehydratase family protein [Opitutae bacterium]
MKVLVTGGTGFLGRHLVPDLQRSGAEVTVINSRNCDLTDRQNLRQFQDMQFDRIYHLAAWTKAGDFCLYHKGEQWIINQQINTNVLWFWREFQPKAVLIAMGTGCAYPPEMILREENYMAGEPDRDLYTYAMTKRMLYSGQLALNHQYGMSYRHLIPSTLFGPKFDRGDSHFIFDLIKKIVAGKTTGAPVALWGNGQQIRELIYVDDAVKLIHLATEHCPNDLLNLGSGQGATIREYAEMICDIVGYDPARIIYDTTKFTGVSKKVFNTDKIKRLFDFQFTSIRQGLEETIRYYRSLPQ